MKEFVNKNKIIEAYIREPNKNTGEDWDDSVTCGWALIITIGYDQGQPITRLIERDSEASCHYMAQRLDLTSL